PRARPAAEVTACCSAMPTSNVRSGKRSAKRDRPVGASMAAVMATRAGCRAPSSASSAPNTSVQVGEAGPSARGTAGVAGWGGHRVEAVGFVLFRGGVAAPLLRQAVHDDRPAETCRVVQGLLQGGDVVSVDGTYVGRPHILEHAVRGAFLGAQQSQVLGDTADRGSVGTGVVVEDDEH